MKIKDSISHSFVEAGPENILTQKTIQNGEQYKNFCKAIQPVRKNKQFCKTIPFLNRLSDRQFVKEKKDFCRLAKLYSCLDSQSLKEFSHYKCSCPSYCKCLLISIILLY